MRDALNHETKAMSFLSSKEVTVPAWRKRPDNEIVDPTGQEATAWVDVSIRALVQEKMLPLKQLMQYAVQEKRGQYPLKTSQGHRVVSGDFVPFVMTNMGSLDKAAHQFLRKLRKKSRKRTDHLMDVLVVQHAKWIARRLQRSLGHFNTPVSERPTRPRQQFSTAKQPSRGRLQTLHDGIRNPSTRRSSVQRPSRRGRPPKESLAADGGSAVGLGRELSLSFEQEMEAEADAQEDYRMLRAREAGNLHSVSVMLHRGGSAQRSSAAVFANPLPPLPSPLPIGVGESASTTSGSDPLQSEVLSKVNSNFGAVQDVAQPDAQLADQYFAQPESSP